MDQDTCDPALRPNYISAVQLGVLSDARVAVRQDTGQINQAPHAYVQIIDPRLDAVLLTCTNVDDQLQGTNFAETMEGGAGKDKIAGIGGDHRLSGGLGRDSSILAATSGQDRVTDFKSGQDLLDLSPCNVAAEALSHLSQGAEGA